MQLAGHRAINIPLGDNSFILLEWLLDHSLANYYLTNFFREAPQNSHLLYVDIANGVLYNGSEIVDDNFPIRVMPDDIRYYVYGINWNDTVGVKNDSKGLQKSLIGIIYEEYEDAVALYRNEKFCTKLKITVDVDGLVVHQREQQGFDETEMELNQVKEIEEQFVEDAVSMLEHFSHKLQWATLAAVRKISKGDYDG